MILFAFLHWFCISPNDYKFEPDTSTTYAVKRGNYYYYGVLDTGGKFIVNTDTSPTQINTNGRTTVKGRPLMAIPEGGTNQCYEYRSGILIPGKLVNDQFISEVGGKAIPIFFYNPSTDIRFIYNLPGRLVYAPKR